MGVSYTAQDVRDMDAMIDDPFEQLDGMASLYRDEQFCDRPVAAEATRRLREVAADRRLLQSGSLLEQEVSCDHVAVKVAAVVVAKLRGYPERESANLVRAYEAWRGPQQWFSVTDRGFKRDGEGCRLA